MLGYAHSLVVERAYLLLAFLLCAKGCSYSIQYASLQVDICLNALSVLAICPVDFVVAAITAARVVRTLRHHKVGQHSIPGVPLIR